MVLLVHLWVLTVGRLRITAVVTIGTVVRIAVGGGILSHALRKTWALGAILRSSRVAGCRRLIPDRRELRVLRRLAGYTDCLSHLAVDGSLRSTTVVGALLDVSAVSLFVRLACGFLLLLLGLPLFPNFLEFYKIKLV
jgi:hypothetical protein